MVRNNRFNVSARQCKREDLRLSRLRLRQLGDLLLTVANLQHTIEERPQISSGPASNVRQLSGVGLEA
jgi:hypothetical protein